jgi:N-acetylneuraminate synthase/N,N'-diacetyllegionaminate synthase
MKNVSTISGRGIGGSHRCFIIAEAGVNHNGDLAWAKQLVIQAKRVGADCVKFQTFKADRIVTQSSPKAAYQLKTTTPSESQFDMLKKLELDDVAHRELFSLAHQEGILCISTPYSPEDIDLLATLGCPALKIASGQIIEPDFLARAARTGLPIVLSTGMATMAEVAAAVELLYNNGCKELTLMQCTTNYPSRVEDANLRVMETYARSFGVPVGYSDHTEGITICVAAVALGAAAIEKHFTLDRSAPGPDHQSSSDPAEFQALVQSIRNVEVALGDGVKRPTDAERLNAQGMRRSIVTRSAIAAGSILKIEDLTCKRPAIGLPPALLSQLVGRRVKVDLPPNALINSEHLNR